MVRKALLSGTMFVSFLIFFTLSSYLAFLIIYQNNQILILVNPMKVENTPNLIITSPSSTVYSVNNITVALSGNASYYWYYITGIDTLNRTWSVPENRILINDGSYTLHAYGNDSSGNITHLFVTFIIDTLPPIITSLQAFDEPGGYSLAEGQWHRDTDPFFTWDVSPDVSGILGYSTSTTGVPDTVVDTTEKSQALADLPEGTTIFSVRACDNAGHWGSVTYFSFNVDTVGDSVSISSLSHPEEGNWYSNNTVSFNWSVSSFTSPIVGYSYIFDQIPATEPDAEVETSAQSLSFVNISEGIWYFHLRAIDQANNVGSPDHYTIMIDTSLPTITSLLCYSEAGGYPIAENDWHQDTDPFLVWEVSYDVNGILGYSTSISGVPDTIIDTTEKSQALADLPEGTTIFSVRACDNAGHWGPATNFSLNIDTVGDSVSISSLSHPEEGNWYSNSTVLFNWSSSSSSPILGYSYIYDQLPATEPDSVVETINQSLIFTNVSEGIWYFHLRVIDQANNVGSTAHYTIMIDVSFPIILNLLCYSEAGGFTILENDWYQDTDPFLVWEVSSDANGILGYSISTTGVPDTTVDTTEKNKALADLPEGTTNFSVRACDNAGHWGPISYFLINIDTMGDNIIITSPSHPLEDTWFNNNSPQFIWSASSTSPIVGCSYVFDQLSSTEPDAVVETSDHLVSFYNVSNGIWYLHLRVIDQAGNVGPTFHYTIRINTSIAEITEKTTTVPHSSEITHFLDVFSIILISLLLSIVLRKKGY